MNENGNILSNIIILKTETLNQDIMILILLVKKLLHLCTFKMPIFYK